MQTDIIPAEQDKKIAGPSPSGWLWKTNDSQIVMIFGFVAFLVFANSLGNQFVYDDHYLIEWNNALRDSSYFSKIFIDSHSYDVSWLNVNTMTVDYYRPFRDLVQALAFKAFGLQTTYWHLLNISIFIGIVLLAFVVIKQMSKSRAVAIAGSLLFIAHPIHSEVVSWINCLGELLHALFFLGAFALYLQNEIESRKRNYIFFIGSLTLFVAALCSKEAALCFPILVAAYKFIHTEKGFVRRAMAAAWSAMAYLLIVAFYIVWRYYVYGGSLRFGSKLPLKMTLLTIPSVILEYIRTLFYPVGLSVVHSVPIIADLSSLRFWLPLLLLVLAGILIWLRAPRRAVFACAWIIITMLPVLNIGGFNPELNVQDRYAFLPSLGFCAAVAIGMCYLLEHPSVRHKAILLGLIAVTMVCLFWLTVRQNRVWRDDQALWGQALVQNPNSNFVRCNYASSLFMVGKKGEAAEYSKRILELKDGRVRCHCINLGDYYIDRKDYDQAIFYYQQAILTEEDKGINLLVFTRLAYAYSAKGHYKEAINLLEMVMADHPDFQEGRKTLEILKRYKSGQ
jgi:protein O-mannosyl-transferase